MEKLNFNPTMATLAELIRLLDYPTFLSEKIRELKTQESTSEEVAGFIVLYDQYKGDVQKIKNYLEVSKQKITRARLPKTRTLHFVKYAAFFALILGLAAYFTLQNTTQNYYKTYADTDQGLPVFMCIEKNVLDNWMLEYKDKHYVNALKTGIQLLKENPGNDTICYYLGVIQLELNHPTQAQHFFSKINTTQSSFSEQTTWLTAICWMYTDKLKAKKILDSIAHSNRFYKAKAKVLLEEEF